LTWVDRHGSRSPARGQSAPQWPGHRRRRDVFECAYLLACLPIFRNKTRREQPRGSAAADPIAEPGNPTSISHDNDQWQSGLDARDSGFSTARSVIQRLIDEPRARGSAPRQY